MRRIGDHVVVLGASLAGLVAARVLADAYSGSPWSSATPSR
jgi:predicted oxidoreductase